MVLSLSSERAMAYSSSSPGRWSAAIERSGSVPGCTIVYLKRSQRLIGGASSPPELPGFGLEGIEEGYRSPDRVSFRRWPLPRTTLGRAVGGVTNVTARVPAT